MSERVGSALILLLVLVLPVSALVARRMPVQAIFRYALAWVGVFIALFVIAVLFT